MYVFALIETICRVLSLETPIKAPRAPAHPIGAAESGPFGLAQDGGSRDFPFPRSLHHFEAAKHSAGRPPWWNGHLRGSFR